MILRSRTRAPIAFLFVFAGLLLLSCTPLALKLKRAELLYHEGQALLSKGEDDKAMEKFQESLALAREAEFAPGVAHNLNEMAIYYSGHGEQTKARDLLHEALAIYRQRNMQPEISKSLNNIALTYIREKDYYGALQRYEELLAWDRGTGNQLGVAITINNVGLIYEKHLHKRTQAIMCYREALEIFRQLGKDDYSKAVEARLRGIE